MPDDAMLNGMKIFMRIWILEMFFELLLLLLLLLLFSWSCGLNVFFWFQEMFSGSSPLGNLPFTHTSNINYQIRFSSIRLYFPIQMSCTVDPMSPSLLEESNSSSFISSCHFLARSTTCLRKSSTSSFLSVCRMFPSSSPHRP
jgi:hypothetical protein